MLTVAELAVGSMAKNCTLRLERSTRKSSGPSATLSSTMLIFSQKTFCDPGNPVPIGRSKFTSMSSKSDGSRVEKRVKKMFLLPAQWLKGKACYTLS